MHVRKRGWAVWVLCVMFAGAASAQDAPEASEGDTQAGDVEAAQNAEQERAMTLMDEEARQHFKLGKALYDAGRFPDAAREFEEAYTLSKRPQLLYNLYVAHRDASNFTGAVEALQSYLEQVPDAPDRVNLRARLKSMQEAAKLQAENEALAREAAEPEQQAPATRTEVVRSIIPYVMMGAGGALIVGGAVTGVLAQGKAGDLDDACTSDQRCPSSEKDTIDSTKALAITTDVLLGVGIAAAGTGLVLWLTGALDEEREVPVASLGCGQSGCMLSLTERF